MEILSWLRSRLAHLVATPEWTDGTPLGTPSHDLDAAPPSVDQESNRAVSGGGLVGTSGPPKHKARRSL